MNQVIKTIVPLAPLCSRAQESLIGAASAHRRVVSQSVSCAENMQSPLGAQSCSEGHMGAAASSVGRVPPGPAAPSQ